MQDVGVCAAVLPPFAIDRDSLKLSIETFQRVFITGQLLVFSRQIFGNTGASGCAGVANIPVALAYFISVVREPDRGDIFKLG